MSRFDRYLTTSKSSEAITRRIRYDFVAYFCYDFLCASNVFVFNVDSKGATLLCGCNLVSYNVKTVLDSRGYLFGDGILRLRRVRR